MSYSWFRVEAALVDHPKAMRLAAKLEEPLAIAYLLKLWSWVHRYAPSGEFSAELTPQVEAYLGWRGIPGKLLSVATEVGLLDLDGGTFCVHDWPEFQGALVDKSNKDKELKRKRRAIRGARTARAENAPRAKTARALQDITLHNTTLTKDLSGDALGPLAELWNSTTEPPLPKVAEPRKETKALKRRSLETWAEVFRRINASKFCKGDSQSGWLADFDWAIRPAGKKPEPALKVLEGAFDRAFATGPPSRPGAPIEATRGTGEIIATELII